LLEISEIEMFNFTMKIKKIEGGKEKMRKLVSQISNISNSYQGKKN